jgi:hypothetical protein
MMLVFGFGWTALRAEVPVLVFPDRPRPVPVVTQQVEPGEDQLRHPVAVPCRPTAVARVRRPLEAVIAEGSATSCKG